uniref:Uncharacterized protein n=1 Tax=Panagrolaimus sp. ES5 TaxID=591445 RepID=A0AC34GTH4_9BILA
MSSTALSQPKNNLKSTVSQNCNVVGGVVESVGGGDRVRPTKASTSSTTTLKTTQEIFATPTPTPKRLRGAAARKTGNTSSTTSATTTIVATSSKATTKKQLLQQQQQRVQTESESSAADPQQPSSSSTTITTTAAIAVTARRLPDKQGGTPMASSDSGVESIDILNDNKDDGTHNNRNANVGTPSESSSSSVTVSPHSSSRRDIIICGDCHHEFPISQFSIFMDHKMSRCDGKQTPSSDDVTSMIVDSPPAGDSAFSRISRRALLLDHSNVKREINTSNDQGLFFFK